MKKDDCIFCKLANGVIPTNAVYEDDDFKCILDMGPASKGHTLILPKEHMDSLLDVDDNTASKALLVAKKVANAMKKGLGCDGVNLLQNSGEAADQTVMHLHFHLIPRSNGDNVGIGWKPGSPSAEELAETAKIISENM